MHRAYDVRAVREQFPALGRTHNGRKVVYFDGPGGSQMAGQAIDAVSRYMNRGGANHRANVDPWLLAAAEKGSKVRWVKVNPETLTLDPGDLEVKITDKTSLVAVGLASNAVGTVNDVSAIARRAHEAGAFVAVDAAHAAPHITIDRDATGADVLTCSAYKFFGPHVGVTVVKRDLLEAMSVYKAEPAPDYIPDKLETGTQNHEGIAGVKGGHRLYLVPRRWSISTR